MFNDHQIFNVNIHDNLFIMKQKLIHESSKEKTPKEIAKNLMDMDVDELFDIQGTGDDKFKMDGKPDAQQVFGGQYSPDLEVIHAAAMAKSAEGRKKKSDLQKTPKQIEMEQDAMNPQDNPTPIPWTGLYNKLLNK